MLLRFSAILLLTLSSCVGVHKDNMASTKDGAQSPLLVSVEVNNQMSTDNFITLEFTLENKAEDYLRFENIYMELKDDLKKDVKIVVGQDLVSWSEGIQNKIQRDNYNFQTFMAGVGAIAGVSAALSKDPKYAKMAAGVSAAGFGTIAVDNFIQVRDNVKNTLKTDTRGLIPDNHILATPISVPPNLFLKRFAVFYVTKSAKAQFSNFDLKFIGNDKTKDVVLNARFKEEALKSAKCESTQGTMYFKSKSVSCANECLGFHPLDQKNCIEQYKRKFN